MCIITVDYSHTFHFLTCVKMHICSFSSLFIKLLHVFVLPDVVSASIADVAYIEVALSVTPVSTELTEILNKSYLVFFMTYHIYIECINIYSYI